MKSKGNIFGILGLCIGWAIPIVGLVFGIISLARKEDDVSFGILSICLSIASWWAWFLIS